MRYFEALGSLKGGTQTVTVQHVNVASGGQAAVGNVQTQGPRRQGGKSKNG
jgi:hypothetical protein